MPINHLALVVGEVRLDTNLDMLLPLDRVSDDCTLQQDPHPTPIRAEALKGLDRADLPHRR